MHNNVPVRSVLAMRGIIPNSCCPLCNNFQETISHLLRDCMVAKDFWYNLKVPFVIVSSFVDMDLFCWLRVNSQSKVSHPYLMPWSYVFTFAIWNLWKHRNEMVFNNIALNVNLHRFSTSQALEFYYSVGKLKSQRSMVVCNVSWKKPPSGWCKLNTDGASLGNPGKVGGGGIIRDSDGKWMKGFARSIGFTTSITAEFWALRDGLLLADQIGVQNLEIELDAKVVVELVQSKNPSKSISNSHSISIFSPKKSLFTQKKPLQQPLHLQIFF